MTDEALCQKLKNGSRAALNEAIIRYTPYVSTVVWRIFASSSATREDLEEVIADTFLALWNHASEIDPAQIRPWLATVAKHRAIDRLRMIAPTIPLSEEDTDTLPGPEETVIQKERAKRLWDAVNDLDEPDRTLFLRHYYEGDKIKDVAHELGMNIATAKTRLHRGRKLLKTKLLGGGDGK